MQKNVNLGVDAFLCGEPKQAGAFVGEGEVALPIVLAIRPLV
ncbi:hypothetical protein ATPR_1843 [Acetobacter tropicalis NBRC 101654]|uniref:Uncharacterized protein n=1 Tax=Acetobacter tropicalis NBRC 101654 TaxID=749388 RepID=F7VEP4_9PROT|nr:hypothetical protein ATPR_1843 [Acetobacter tropicalis NBRC 101654]